MKALIISATIVLGYALLVFLLACAVGRFMRKGGGGGGQETERRV